jgi:Co/Zn/Cd efflux system component
VGGLLTNSLAIMSDALHDLGIVLSKHGCLIVG